MKSIRIGAAALALVSGAALIAFGATSVGAQDGSPTAAGTSTSTADDGTTTSTPASGGSLATTTPSAAGTSTPVAGGASQLPSTGTGDSSSGGYGLMLALAGLAVAGLGAFALAGRTRS